MSTSTVNNNSSGVVLDEASMKAPLQPTIEELDRLLTVMEQDILPVTEKGVQAGNKVFGAAVLDGNFQTVYAGTNTETECPIFHGEVKVIYEWSQITKASERGKLAQSSVFLATHEPCCMCVSSILWAGFPVIYYFFPYTVTSAQGIPHDIKTMHELWNVPSYRKRNAYFSSACILDLIEALDESDEKKELQNRVQKLFDAYDVLSKKYHTEKANNPQNSLVLN